MILDLGSGKRDRPSLSVRLSGVTTGLTPWSVCPLGLFLPRGKSAKWSSFREGMPMPEGRHQFLLSGSFAGCLITEVRVY